MVRIELEKNLYVVIGNSYNIKTSFQTEMGGRHTHSYRGVVAGIVGEDLILSRGTIAYSKLACWGGYETGIRTFQDQRVPLRNIESIVKVE